MACSPMSWRARNSCSSLCLFWWSQYTVRYLAGHAEAESSAYRASEVTVLAATTLAQAAASVAALLAIAVSITPALAFATALFTVTRGLNLYLGERARAGKRVLDYTLAQTLGPVGGFSLAFALVSNGWRRRRTRCSATGSSRSGCSPCWLDARICSSRHDRPIA